MDWLIVGVRLIDAHFQDGCLSHEWGAIQQSHLEWTDSKQTGKRWVLSGLTRQLCEVITPDGMESGVYWTDSNVAYNATKWY